MLIFKESNKSKKSWSLYLETRFNESCLVAVDSITGEHAADFITFYPDGVFKIEKNADKALNNKGYDLYEHNTSYDVEGRIFIR